MAIALILPIWRVKLRLRLWGYVVGFPGLEEEHTRRFAYSLLATDPRVSFGSQRDVMMGVHFPPCSSLTSKGKQTRD